MPNHFALQASRRNQTHVESAKPAPKLTKAELAAVSQLLEEDLHEDWAIIRDKLGELRAKQAEWANKNPGDKAQMLEAILKNLASGKEVNRLRWGQAALAAEGMDPNRFDAALAHEILTKSHAIYHYLALLRDQMAHFAANGDWPPVTLRQTELGHAVCEVNRHPYSAKVQMPHTTYKDWSWEVWLPKNQYGVAGTRGSAYRGLGELPGSNAIILGNGSQGFVVFLDILHALFVKNQVVFVKHHPRRAYQHAVCEKLFEPLISRGYLVSWEDDGRHGAAIGRMLATAEHVSRLHVSGSQDTVDNIIEAQKAGPPLATPRLPTSAAPPPPTGEYPTLSACIGGCNPYIIAGGDDWTAEQLCHHALQLVAAFTTKGARQCSTPRVLILHESWGHRETFEKNVWAALKERRPPPSAGWEETVEMHGEVREKYPDAASTSQTADGFLAEIIAEPTAGAPLPWLLVRMEIDASDPSSLFVDPEDVHVLEKEVFGPVLTVCTIRTSPMEMDPCNAKMTPRGAVARPTPSTPPQPATPPRRRGVPAGKQSPGMHPSSPKVPRVWKGSGDSASPLSDFLKAATRVCNEMLTGGLAATLVVPPNVQAEEALAVETCIAELKYGVVGVNVWAGLAHFLEPGVAWGTHPQSETSAGNPKEGNTLNGLLFDHVEKTVVRTPFIAEDHYMCSRKIHTSDSAMVATQYLVSPSRQSYMKAFMRGRGKTLGTWLQDPEASRATKATQSKSRGCGMFM